MITFLEKTMTTAQADLIRSIYDSAQEQNIPLEELAENLLIYWRIQQAEQSNRFVSNEEVMKEARALLES